MNYFRYPFLVLALSFVVLWLSARIGVSFRKRRRNLEEDEREDFGIIVAAVLTLLGLIIGFSFSMAVSRYDQRKNYEEAEANAIGTEYVRAGLLPAADAERLHGLLRNYLDQRVLFYQTRDQRMLRQIDASTAQLEADLWSAVQAPAAAQPTPMVALAVWGMNEVLNSQGYTQAAWWNRIPIAAWVRQSRPRMVAPRLPPAPATMTDRRRQTSGSGVISCPDSRRVCYCPTGLLTGISVLIPHCFEMTFLLLL
jgi:hypothetical protein